MNPEEFMKNYNHIIPNDFDGESNAIIILCVEDNRDLVEIFNHG